MIPIPPRAILLAVVGVVLAGAFAIQSARLHHARLDASAARAQLLAERAALSAAAADAERLARLEEQRRAAATEEITHANATKVARLRDDAARAADAVRGLRERLAQLAGASDPGAADPGLAIGRPTAGDLAELLGACGERYQAVAAAADERHAAGLACEQSFDAVRGR